MLKTLVYLSIVQFCTCQDDWHPVLNQDLYQKTSYAPITHSFSSLVAQQYQPLQPATQHRGGGGQCDLYKVGFNQDLYFQYVQYKVEMPDLKEFTLCFWNKFQNHTNDHPIFSYAVDGQPRAIYSWVSNTDRSSYYSMSINGHTFYRLNYPLRLNRWYHTCQSWNGKTGEWQIWVNAERVGRGFNNRLVGYVIPHGGVAITGQAQSQLGGGFLEGHDAPKGSGGMVGEITMLQLYSVALTAGKAHKDHKHHHAHKYDHNGAEITTTPAPSTTPRPAQPTHPLITGGQLNPGVAFNIAAQQPQPFQAPQFLDNPFGAAQAAPGQGPQTFQAPQPQQQPQSEFIQIPQLQQTVQSQAVQFVPSAPAQNEIGSYSQQSLSIGGRPLLNSGLVHSVRNVQFVQTAAPLETHTLFRRDSKKSKREVKDTKSKRGVKDTKSKRELILAGGHLIDDGVLTSVASYDQNLLTGLAGIGENEPVLQEQKKMEEREPAEAEVMAVMNVCSGCDPEPFGKALVFGWRTVAKKLYSGAIYSPANTECRVF